MTNNNNIAKLSLVISGALLFNLVFWQEKLGVNAVLFDAFILSALFIFYPSARQHTIVRWLILGHLLCLAMVVVHNTLLSKIAFSITLLLLTGFAEYIHRSLWYAGGSVLMNIVMVAASFTELLHFKKSKRQKRKKFATIIRFAIFPVMILLVFFIIYGLANSIFLDMASRLGAQLEDFFVNFFTFFSWDRWLFLLLGLLITASLLLKSRVDYFSRKEVACNDGLQRVRNPLRKPGALVRGIMGRFATGPLALKNENITGIISLALLNGLLLFINIIDINYLWFNFEYDESKPIYKLVHEGTELLILSIVLAMAIVLFFFKGNLNFYKRNKWLQYGARAWILQNAVLVVSVAVRDYYYIERHGLAYKRIGVLFFLLMVLIGLTTVFIKISYRKTGYYLFRVNAWAAAMILVVSTTIHWDELIAGYNLHRKDKVPLDVPFLLSLSDKTLPLLEKNIDVLQMRQDTVQQQRPGREYNAGRICDTCFVEQLRRRERLFIEQQQQLSWLSWNYSDAFTRQYFRNKKPGLTANKIGR